MPTLEPSSAGAAAAVAFVRFSVPDMGQLDAFLGSFGLTATLRQDQSVYYRAADAAPYVYVATAGPAQFDGFAFDVGTEDRLREFSEAWSVPVEPLDGPGDGERAVLSDPDGFQVEAVWFRTPSAPVALRPSLAANTVDAHPRVAVERGLALRGAQVCRLGHVVLGVTDLRASEAWYKARFGLLTSDEIVRDDGEGAMGMFLRLNLGPKHTDHHSLFLIEAEEPTFNHAAFEVRDLDDVMVGHDLLRQAGYRHHKGVGRHKLGGQVFDYWRDPWGHVLEHWTDGDIFDAAWGPRISTIADLYADLWRSEPGA